MQRRWEEFDNSQDLVDDFHRRYLIKTLSNQAKEGLKCPNLTDLKTPTLISFLGLLPRQRGRCLLEGGVVLRTHALAYGLAVRPWRTQGCLLYLVALLHLPFFFRFDVLV